MRKKDVRYRNGGDKTLILTIVISKVDAEKEARINFDSSLDEILYFLKLLGVDGWTLYEKGGARLECNGPVLYVAIGPLDTLDLQGFLRQVRSSGCLEKLQEKELAPWK